MTKLSTALTRAKTWVRTTDPATLRRGAMVFIMTATTLMQVWPAHAQPPTPGNFGDAIVNILFAIAQVVVTVAVAGSLALVAIGIARGTISAQWAVTVGSSMGVSQAWTTIMMTIVTGALAAASPILIGLAADAIRPYVSTTIVLPRWTSAAPDNAAGGN